MTESKPFEVEKLLKWGRESRERNSIHAQLDLLCRSERLDVGQLVYIFGLIEKSNFKKEWPFDELLLKFEMARDWGFDPQALSRLHRQLKEYFTDVGRPMGIHLDDGCDLSFKGKTFCFTGELSYGRALCGRITEGLGGASRNVVQKNLDYLVIGRYSSPGWPQTKYGQKIRAAVEINRERASGAGGSKIRIISEKYWIQSVEASMGLVV